MNVIARGIAALLACASTGVAQQRPLPITVDPRAAGPAKRLTPLTLYDSSYHRARQLFGLRDAA